MILTAMLGQLVLVNFVGKYILSSRNDAEKYTSNK